MARRGGSTTIRLVPVALGLLGILAALVLATVAGHFMTWHFLLGGLSLASIVLGLAWIQEARWRDLLASLVYTAFFILCVVLVYLVSANRHGRMDITASRVHTLSSQTKAVLTQLPADERFTLMVFAPLQEHLAYQRFLNNYRRTAPQIRYELYDPARDLDVVLRMEGQVEEHGAILTRQNAAGELLRKESFILKLADDTREQTLTNAIARTLFLEQGAVYYITGHGEKKLDDSDQGYSKLVTYLEGASFPVRPYRLLQGPVPDDAAALVLAGPTTDLFDQEKDVLLQYLNNGGKLLLLYDPVFRNESQFGNFEAFLDALGIESRNEVVVDPVAVNASNSGFTPLVTPANHPIFSQGGMPPFMLNIARDFIPAEIVAADLAQEVVLRSHSQTWTERIDDLRSVRSPKPPDDPAEIRERFLAVSIEKPTSGGRHGNMMRVVLVGDSDAFMNMHLEKNGGAAAFFAATLGWLRESQKLVYIPPATLQTTPVALTSTNFYTLLGAFLFAGLAITLGGTGWALVRRRAR